HDQYYDNMNDVAYCIYQTDLSGYTGSPTIGFDWADNGQPRIPDKYYVGLSNWDSNRWSWFDGPLDQVLTVDDLAPFIDGNGRMLITLLVIQRENVVVLHTIKVGAPEQRGTGFELEDIPIKSSVPPLYVPQLPATLDLSDGCAPVNDQGTWGACTAFAVGDGAYNYELNSIYGQLGWNLEDAANRVSPKYLYIESGKYEGFPPGPDYGRYTDEVAADLMQYGVATEAHAPYDLVYDDNWTIAALDDADLLKTSSYVPLPCRTNAGIDSIRTVLAIQRRPVLLSTQVDFGLFYYEPGTVWDFTGPSFGGHAMLIVGYDDARQAFKLRNSWGVDWGEDGYLWMSYASLKNPYNWYAQCGYIQDDYDPVVAQHFTGQTLDILPPAKLEASDGSAGDVVSLSWDAVENATGYRVYRDTADTPIAELGAVTQYTDSSPGDSLAHVYWVSALQDSTESSRCQPDLGFTAQSPSITGVSPQSGAEGQQIRFVPEAFGEPDMSFAWDFGGGAIPNTSTETGPLVVLGSQGSYDATLTITSSEGVMVHNWTLTVQANQPPVAYLDNPDQDPAIAPYDCHFEASGGDDDGYIVLYEFDWENDGVYDLVTTEGNVTHTYT
ncbi:MAG: C1 family peptidase, partial [Anaerocolumna sp.]